MSADVPFRVDAAAGRAWKAAHLDAAPTNGPLVILPAVDIEPEDPRVPNSARKLHALIRGAARLTYAAALIGSSLRVGGDKPIQTVALRWPGGWYCWRDGKPFNGAVLGEDGLPRPVGLMELKKILNEQTGAGL